MSIWLSLQLVVAGVVLLAFGLFSTGRAIRLLSGSAALLIAILGSAGAAGLFWLGQKNRWTSDGPGALFVMIALVACGIAALVGWAAVFAIGSGAGTTVRALPDAPPAARRLLRVAGLMFLVIGIVGRAVLYFGGRGTTHAAPVVAVSLASYGTRLVSVDAGGTVVDWALEPKRVIGRQTIPALAGATEVVIADGQGVFAVVEGKAVRFDPVRSAPVESIPGARHIACGAAVVIARDQSLLFASYDDWMQPPPYELAWPEPIQAIAARDMFAAVADRSSITLLDGRPGLVRKLASVATPGTIRRLELLPEGIVLALEAGGAGWVVDTRRGLTAPVATRISLASSAARTFLVSDGEVSEYDVWRKVATPLGAIGSGVQSIDTVGNHVAFGFDDGDVVVGRRTGSTLELAR